MVSVWYRNKEIEKTVFKADDGQYFDMNGAARQIAKDIGEIEDEKAIEGGSIGYVAYNGSKYPVFLSQYSSDNRRTQAAKQIARSLVTHGNALAKEVR